MKTTLQYCINLFEHGESFVTALVLSREGSAPRRTGARMIIRINGKSFGTIGGGSLETEVKRRSENIFTEKKPAVHRFDLTGDIGGGVMLCGGRVDVLLDYMDSKNQKLKSAWHAALQAIQAKQSAWMITAVPNGRKVIPRAGFCTYVSGEATGALQPGSALLQQLTDRTNAHRPWITDAGEERFFVEPLTGLLQVFIFGSGHIAQQLAMLTVLAGFKTTVLDDRRDDTVRHRFPLADEIALIKSYGNPFKDITIDQDSYIVILTRYPSLDKQVLEAALTTNAAYIGMIGSKHKCRALRNDLANTGLPPEAFKRLHAPIGIPIGADSPEEVAISIAAELIQQRSAGPNSINYKRRRCREL